MRKQDAKAEHATPTKKKRKPVAISNGTPPKPKTKIHSLKPASPVVNVEITVLDDRGKPVKQERRVSRPDVQMNPSPPQRAPITYPGRKAHSGKSKQEAIVLSDDDDDEEYVPRTRVRTKPSKASKARVIVSSDEDSEIEFVDPPKTKVQSSSTSAKPPRPKSPPKPRNKPVVLLKKPSDIAVPANPRPNLPEASAPPPRPVPVLPTFRLPQHNAIHFSPLVRRDVRRTSHVSTPYRSRPSRAGFPAPPSPPSPTTPSDLDEDLSVDFGQLALSSRTLNAQLSSIPVEHEPPPPAYLKPLLESCSQTTTYEFSAFIEMFPFDPIVHTSHGGVGINPLPTKQKQKQSKQAATFQKIGEASFSEVFGIGDVVLKVIPLRDEDTKSGKPPLDNEDVPAPSDAKDVLREIIVTRAMGEMCEGFVQLLRTYVVRGKYPSVLLDLWDEYDERKGSESVRPDGFGVSQLYAIIVLPNGGPDLETFTFTPSNKNSWGQACSIFWQVVRALAEAEDMVHFEHRDLHWGQILVKNVTSTDPPPSLLSRKRKTPMDHDVHGVKATVIDLGLSRMETGEADGLHFTVPDEEVFEGEGDYQFDVYRMMKNHNGGSWRAYRPLTNVMWLHYLLNKLLHEKRLRAPIAQQRGPAAMFSERECYLALVEMEAVLGQTVASCKAPVMSKKGRRKTQASVGGVADERESGGVRGPKCANDVLEIGMAKRWIS
ncbi:hypothetical protein BC629DRAFT_1298885 [Irpex lacteus]|nr:hypothetical protein BC629DRAFT_1298885 [Irpex lacteus]